MIAWNNIKEQPLAINRQHWPGYKKSTWELGELKGYVGLDLEYHPETLKPYMVSIACNGMTCSVPIEKAIGLCQKLPNDPDVQLVGHNLLSADLDVLHKTFGTPLMPKAMPIDTILLYYALNPHLCQGAQKEDEAGIDFNRGQGKLSLSSMLSLYLPWAEYKTCRGQICEGPCPEHDEPWYNSLDSLGPVETIPIMIEEAKTFTSDQYPNGVPLMDKIYPHLLNLQYALNKMTEIGVLVDRDAIKRISAEVEEERKSIFPRESKPRYGKRGQRLKKDEIVYQYGFNPDSPKAVREYFSQKGVDLDHSDAEHIKKAIDDAEKQGLGYTADVLRRLLKYKKVGRGLKNWFADEYIHEDDRLHSRWSAFGGAMGRPVSSGPNQQNFPKRGSLYRARQVLVAPPGMKILKADCKQGEPRCMMHIGGMDPKDVPPDVYNYTIEKVGEENFAQLVRDSPTYSKILDESSMPKAIRALAKRVVMAYLYGEGMALVTEDQYIRNTRSQYYKDFRGGGLFVCDDWIVNDKQVAFTGTHLAKDLYQSVDYGSRKKALEFQQIIMDSVPSILRAQKKILKEAEKGYVVLPSGRLFQLINSEDKNIRTALATHGQTTLTDYMQESLLIYDNLDYLPAIYIHDEFGFYVPKEWDRKKCLNFIKPMQHKSTLIPDDFWCPTDAAWGPDYYHLEDIE